MSAYPCSLCRKRAEGALSHAYPALIRGTHRMYRRLRLCQAHFDGLLGDGEWGFFEVSPETEMGDDSLCRACLQQAFDALDPVFVSAYRRGEDRTDYYTSLCGSCGDRFVLTYGLKESEST